MPAPASGSVKGRTVTCRVCARSFGSDQAYQQHRIDSHMRMPAPSPRTRMQRPEPVSAMAKGIPLAVISNGISPRGALGGTAIASLGSTPAGRGWASRALHPNDDRHGGGAMIPTQDNAKTAAIELRMDTQIASPYSNTSNWDLQIMFTPFVDVHTVYRTRYSGGGAWSNWQILTGHSIINRSGTLVPAPDNDDTQRAKATSVPAMADQSQAFRQTFRGYTIDLDAPATDDQGMVVAGQYADAIEDDLIAAQLNVGPGVNDRNIMTSFILKDVPRDPSALIDKCPTAGQWPARKGIYMPMRFQNDKHEYRSDASTENVTGLTSGGKYRPFGAPVFLRHSDDESLITQVVKVADDFSADWATTTNFINQQTGCAFFVGISPKATIWIKMRLGVQIEPTTDSALYSVTSDAPDVDLQAISAVLATGNRLPIVFESRYNSLGMILPLIAKAAAAVLPSVAPWLIGKIGGVMRPKARYVEEEVD